MADGSSTFIQSISCLLALKRTLKNPSGRVECRTRSSFLMPISGGLIYTFEGGALEVSRSEVVYLPKGSSYTYHVTGGSCSYLIINFEFSEHSGESDVRTVVGKKISKISVVENDYILKFHNVINGYDSHMLPMRLRALAEICDILSLFSGASYEAKGRIDAGISYIDEHKLDPLYVEDAARACGLSVAHFRRLFKEKMGISPLEYKNLLVMRRARELLRDSSLNVTQIAKELHFEDIYSFSKFFKRNEGISPEQFRRSV